MTQWWSMVGDHFNRHMYVSQASYKAIGDSGWGNDEIGEEVDINRSTTLNNSAGTIYYNTNSLMTSQDLVGYLARNKYTRTSLVPMVDWKTHVTYGAVSSLTNNAGTLSWQAMKTAPKAIMRYTVYAVPTGIAYKDAQAADGDGIDGKYLAGITYGTSYTVPTGDYWYAVCILDGLSHEYEPQIIGVAESQNTTLTSPINDEVADGKFTWAAVANATYTLEISASSDFSSVALSQTGITTNSATISLSSLFSNSTYYWRVKTRQTGKSEVVSAVASFTTPAYSPEQMDEAIYSSNGSMEFENLWIRKGNSNLGAFSPNYYLCRDMALDKDYMYIICRESNDATSKCYI